MSPAKVPSLWHNAQLKKRPVISISIPKSHDGAEKGCSLSCYPVILAALAALIFVIHTYNEAVWRKCLEKDISMILVTIRYIIAKLLRAYKCINSILGWKIYYVLNTLLNYNKERSLTSS